MTMGDRKTILVGLLLVGLLAVGAQASSSTMRGQQRNRAALVVDFGNGTFITRCITFSEDSISGYEALMRSDLNVTVNGGAVCGIEGTGCPADNCFCAMPDYWSYWRLADETWQYSATGAPGTVVRDGDVEGWSWGDNPPIVLLHHQVCFPSVVHLPLVLQVGE